MPTNSNTGTLFLGDGTQRSAYQLGTPVTFNGNTLLTSKDGSEVYVFHQSTGRHIEARRPLTGAIRVIDSAMTPPAGSKA